MERMAYDSRDDRGRSDDGQRGSGRPGNERHGRGPSTGRPGNRRRDESAGPKPGRRDPRPRSAGNPGTGSDRDDDSRGSKDFRSRDAGTGARGGGRTPRRDGDRRGGSRGEANPRTGGGDRSFDRSGPKAEGEQRRFGGNRRGDRDAGRGNERRGTRGDHRDRREDRGRPGSRGGSTELDRAEEYFPKPGTTAAPDEPDTPELDEELLPFGVKAELKGLSKELATIVGAHIVAAGQLIDEDPELAFKHAEAARRRAGRLPVVREAAAETAYAAGKYDIALREYRALRRMNGNDELVPVMADCERALGRHRDALELLDTIDRRTTSGTIAIEALLVEAGTRADMGQPDEAKRLLRNAIAHRSGPKTGQARLNYAYADLLIADQEMDAARRALEAARDLDVERMLDVEDRLAELDGIILPESLHEEPEQDETDEEPQDADVPLETTGQEADL